MRGTDHPQSVMFSYVSLEERVPADHPLRPIREMTNRALTRLSGRFSRLYAETGRPSIPPEHLVRALLLQCLYTIRSERMLVEQLQYNLLFRWFVGLEVDDPVWDPTTFSKNRDRLLRGEVAEAFFEAVVAEAREAGLLSDEHFTVDGTLIEAWAGHKSFRPKDEGRGGLGGSERDFHGERRKNETHASTTDPDARLYRKGKGREAKLVHMGHALTDNRHGLVVSTRTTLATGTAEREAAIAMLGDLSGGHLVTMGGDKGYDSQAFVAQARELNAAPHVAQKEHSAIDGRTTRHAGYAISQWKRKAVEQVFGWMKTVGNLRKTRHRGTERVGWMFTFGAAAYDLVRMRTLFWEAPG
jgi:transposase